MAKKGVAGKIRLVSTGINKNGKLTGTTYYVKKGRNIEGKMAFRRYDRRAMNPATGKPGCHVMFEEKKLPPAKKN